MFFVLMIRTNVYLALVIAKVQEIDQSSPIARQEFLIRPAALSQSPPSARSASITLSINAQPPFVADVGVTTSLHIAAATGASTTVRSLIHNGAVTNAVDEEGKTPMHIAAEQGRRGIAQIIALFGADIDKERKKNSS
jgi:ankyrin repeat protein